MLRKSHLITLAVVGLVALVLLTLPEQTRSRVRIAFTSLFLPLFGLAGSLHAAADRAAATLTPRSALAARLAALEQSNQVLRIALAEADAARLENDQLRRMLGYPGRAAWRLLPARVMGRDPANWWRTLHLDVGLRDGVVTNLAVLTPDGLVGRIAECGPYLSRVVLVGDPNCPVGAALADSGDTGIILGAASGDLEGSLVLLSYLSRYATVTPGQKVITSGQGGVFPRGIAIGDVVDARGVGDGIYIQARVRLAVHLGALDQVWVKLP